MTPPDKPAVRERQASREERQAKALRENLARRKALSRAKRDRATEDGSRDAAGETRADDEPDA